MSLVFLVKSPKAFLKVLLTKKILAQISKSAKLYFFDILINQVIISKNKKTLPVAMAFVNRGRYITCKKIADDAALSEMTTTFKLGLFLALIFFVGDRVAVSCLITSSTNPGPNKQSKCRPMVKWSFQV